MQVKLHQEYTAGVLAKAWIGDAADVSSPLGASYAADLLGYLNAIKPIDTSLTALATSQTNNGLGWAQSQVDPNGLTRSFTWDALGALTGIVLPNGEAGTTYTFDHVARQLTVTHGAQVLQYTYNGFGDRILERRQDSLGARSHRATGYDHGGRVAWQTVWRSGNGGLVDWTQALGPDDVTTAGTAAWTEVTGQCISWVRYTDGTSTCRAYQTINHPVIPASTVFKASSHFTYDPYGRVQQISSPNMENPGQEEVSTTYTPMDCGSTKTVTVAQGSSSRRQRVCTFDPLGRIIAVTDAMGQTTTYGYDQADRLVLTTQVDSATGATQTRAWAYDEVGRVMVLDQPESGVTYFTKIRPDGKVQKTVYGLPRGWRPINTREDPSAYAQAGVKTLSTTWDNVGRLKLQASSDGSVSHALIYGESEPCHGLANGKLVHATANGNERILDYTGLNGRLGKLTRKLDGQSFVTSLGYDSTYGMLTSRTYPDGRRQLLEYDWAKGMPKSSGFGLNPVTTDLLSGLTYDPVFWGLTRITWANQATSSLTYRGDQVGLASMVHTLPNGGLSKTWR